MPGRCLRVLLRTNLAGWTDPLILLGFRKRQPHSVRGGLSSGNSLSAAKVNNQRESARGFSTFPSAAGYFFPSGARPPNAARAKEVMGVAWPKSIPRIFQPAQMQCLQKGI